MARTASNQGSSIPRPSLGRADAAVALGLILLTLLIFRDVLVPYRSWVGHDMVGGLMRTAATSRALAEGQWLPRWSRELFGGYGYPLLYFYPPLFALLSGLLSLAGLGTTASVKAVGMAAMMLSSWAMYRLGLRAAGRVGALVGALAWTLFPYRLALHFVRAAWAEALALAILPVAALGLWELRAGRRRAGFLYLALSTAGLVTAHNAVWVMAAPLLTLWGAALLWRSGPRRMGLAASGVATGLLLAAPYWLPAFRHRSLVAIQRLLTSPLVDYRRHFVDPARLLEARWELGGPGPLLLLAIPAGLWGAWHLRRQGRSFGPMVAASTLVGILAACLLLPPARVLWDHLPLLPYVGYPWRFLGPMGFFLVLSLPPLTELVARGGPVGRVLLGAAALALLLVPAHLHARPSPAFQSEHSVGRESCIRCGTTTVAAEEYTPSWVRRDPREELGPRRDLIEPSPTLATAVVEEDRSHALRLVLEAREPGPVVIRTLYFPGWQARLDGVDAAVRPTEPYGFIGLDLPRGVHEVELRFGWVGVQRLALILGLLGMAVLLTVAAGALDRWGAHG